MDKKEVLNDSIISLKNECDDFAVEFDVLPAVDINNIEDDRQRKIIEGVASVDEQLSEIERRIEILNTDIDRLTNHADGIDYAIAVTSGIVTGILDATVVGEWNYSEATAETKRDINNKVIDFAKKHPDYNMYCDYALEGKKRPRLKKKDPDRLETAVSYLEWRYHLPGDGAYRDASVGITPKTHRLDDLCHHPTLVGLVCCVIVQFSPNLTTLYVNQFGESIKLPLTINEYGNFVGNNEVTKLFAGVINWFLTCAKTLANRSGHLSSDISTSASLPGTFLSMITELASIPCFQNEDFMIKLRKAYSRGIGTKKGQVDLGVFNKLFEGEDSRFNIITEKAIGHELKRQAMPVVINEILVRGAYFIRRFIIELKEKQDVMKIEWNNVIPFRNRTIVRMMTIATGTFTAIDMADAAVHAATKSVDAASFFSNMLLRVNFVGVGRMTVAFGTDLGMGISRSVKRNQRIKLHEQQLLLLDAKVSYKQADMWISAESAGKTLEEVYDLAEETAVEYNSMVNDIKESLDNIGDIAEKVESKNPGLITEINDVLKWD